MSRRAAVAVLLAASLAGAGCATTPAPEPAAEAARPWPAAEPAPPSPVDLATCAADHAVFPPDPGGPPVDEAPLPVTREHAGYPEEARARGVQGLVRFRALVCEHGRVVRATLVQSVPLLDGVSREALSRWTFRPARRAGHEVAAWTDVPFRFTIH